MPNMSKPHAGQYLFQAYQNLQKNGSNQGRTQFLSIPARGASLRSI
jgi:hypothetical protein